MKTLVFTDNRINRDYTNFKGYAELAQEIAKANGLTEREFSCSELSWNNFKGIQYATRTEPQIACEMNFNNHTATYTIWK